jgi:ABC-type transport system involved in multi-copper enzyme maturation permease subunit
MKIIFIALNTCREAIRNKILYSVFLFAALLIGVSAFFGSVTIGDQIKVIKDFGLFSLSFFGAIITIISGVTLLNKELNQKTVYNILSKPVARWQFVTGKFLGLAATVSLLVSLMGLAFIGFVAIFEGRLDLLLFQAVVFSVLEVIIVAAVVMFFSSVVVTITLTGIFTLATYIAGRSIGYFKFFTQESPDSSPSLSVLVSIFDKILPDLSLFNVNDAIVYGHSVSASHLGYAVFYTVAYSLVALVVACLIFNKRELV